MAGAALRGAKQGLRMVGVGGQEGAVHQQGRRTRAAAWPGRAQACRSWLCARRIQAQRDCCIAGNAQYNAYKSPAAAAFTFARRCCSSSLHSLTHLSHPCPAACACARRTAMASSLLLPTRVREPAYVAITCPYPLCRASLEYLPPAPAQLAALPAGETTFKATCATCSQRFEPPGAVRMLREARAAGGGAGAGKQVKNKRRIGTDERPLDTE